MRSSQGEEKRQPPRPVREMTLTGAAMELGVIYQTARNLMLTGKLRGRRIEGRWYVVARDVRRLKASRTAKPGQ